MSIVDPWQARVDLRTSRKFTRAAQAPKQHRHDLPISDLAPHTSANCPQCLNPNAPRTTPSVRTSSSSAQSRTRTSTAPPLRYRAQQDRMAHSYARYVQVSILGVLHQLNYSWIWADRSHRAGKPVPSSLPSWNWQATRARCLQSALIQPAGILLLAPWTATSVSLYSWMTIPLLTQLSALAKFGRM